MNHRLAQQRSKPNPYKKQVMLLQKQVKPLQKASYSFTEANQILTEASQALIKAGRKPDISLGAGPESSRILSHSCSMLKIRIEKSAEQSYYFIHQN